jgi:hypothetical protein
MTTRPKQANNKRCKNLKTIYLLGCNAKASLYEQKDDTCEKNFGNISCPCKYPQVALWT